MERCFKIRPCLVQGRGKQWCMALAALLCIALVWPCPPHAQDAGEILKDPQTGMVFVWIQPGTYWMGQSEAEQRALVREVGGEVYRERFAAEAPGRKVQVAGFWLSRFEVTQGLWKRVFGTNPASFRRGEDYPVETVSWRDAQALIAALDQGRRNYRLPTEEEWEYAARAGTDAARFWGDDAAKACRYANVADRAEPRKWVDWPAHDCDDGFPATAPVGSFEPNAWGLYDMLGNVWEWCADSGVPGPGRAHNGTAGAGAGRDMDFRVIRGGSWDDFSGYVRSAARAMLPETARENMVGLRLVLVP